MSHFRLATLLKLRIDERDRRRIELAQALEAQGMLEEQTKQLDDEMQGIQALAGKQVQPGAINVDTLLQLNRYHAQLNSQQKTLKGQIAQIAAEAQRRREALIESDRQVRVLEKLRERQEEAAAASELQKEIKEFDESSAVVFRQQQEANR